MTKRLLLSIALTAAAAFALTIAQPAYACGKDCDCAKKAGATKADEKKPELKPTEKAAPAAPAPAATEKKAEGTTKCECTKGGKGCTCPKGECKCANCGAPKFAAADKAEKKACDCPKTKDCSCPKGECKCGKKDAKGAA
jgi:hypothetical protein